MRSHGRPPAPCMLAIIACTWLSANCLAEPGDPSIEMLSDAELTAVFFLTPDLGWAVGDRGVILRTEDGGRNWQLQRTPVNSRLESVYFVDPRRGWAVGGRIYPYSHRTNGVVLRTQDGGRNWSAVENLTIPQLKQVQFLDGRRGWAVGSPSSMYPTGIFRTEDGGRNWTTLPAGISGCWLAGAFHSEKRGVVVGHDGRLAMVSGSSVIPSKTPGLGLRPIRSIQWETESSGWLVGDGGLVLCTRDGGASWQMPDGPLPPGVIDMFDFRGVSVVGSDVWVAGAPGSCILHSADRGITWELLRTEQQLPIRDVEFVDGQRGWAVGALGTILATRDGGRTWRRQKPGASRLALLGLFAETENVSFELFARESGEQGYIGYAEILGRRDIEIPDPNGCRAEDRCQSAMSIVGASGADHAWNFPLRQTGLLLGSDRVVENWNRANDGQGLEKLQELIVRKIRQWRPDVIVTDPAGPYGGNPVSHVLNQVVLQAVHHAADATRYPEQITLAGLSPWGVTKVFSTSSLDRQATTTIATTQLATRLGCSIADQADNGYALVQSEYEPLPVQVGYRLLMNEIPQSAGRRDFFSGIFLQPGGEARRQLGRPSVQDLDALTRAAQKRRNIEQLIEQSPQQTTDSTAWLGQVRDLTDGLQGDVAGQILYQLGHRYREAGRLEYAAQTFQQLVSQYPRHPLAENAQIWLIQYHTSSEIAWQLKESTNFKSQHVSSVALQQLSPNRNRQGDHLSSDGRSRWPGANPMSSSLQYQGTESTAGINVDSRQRANTALALAKEVQRGKPELYAEPRVQFPVSVAYRVQGMPRESERFYHRLSSIAREPDWASCAKAELWLMHGRGAPPKPTVVCRETQSRPNLDGQLDDGVWENARQIDLSSVQHDDASWPATAMLAFDAEFIYLAVSCHKVPNRKYDMTPGPRPRDADLTDRDRVDLYLDLDRDYASYYRLTVDHRGWTGEACMNDDHWNPTWYVAADETDETWTVEAAIPIDQLAPKPPNLQDVWAFGMQRIVPGVGIQAFSQPASVKPRPEGFSLLVFQ